MKEGMPRGGASKLDLWVREDSQEKTILKLNFKR